MVVSRATVLASFVDISHLSCGSSLNFYGCLATSNWSMVVRLLSLMDEWCVYFWNPFASELCSQALVLLPPVAS
jgi:hypothetical protein